MQCADFYQWHRLYRTEDGSAYYLMKFEAISYFLLGEI